MLCSSWLYLQTVQVQPAHTVQVSQQPHSHEAACIERGMVQHIPLEQYCPNLHGLQLMAEVVLGRVLCLNNTGKNVDIDPSLHILEHLFQNSQR